MSPLCLFPIQLLPSVTGHPCSRSGGTWPVDTAHLGTPPTFIAG